eukprot:6175456-Pleurochrysis_carterae.AAC.2
MAHSKPDANVSHFPEILNGSGSGGGEMQTEPIGKDDRDARSQSLVHSESLLGPGHARSPDLCLGNFAALEP